MGLAEGGVGLAEGRVGLAVRRVGLALRPETCELRVERLMEMGDEGDVLLIDNYRLLHGREVFHLTPCIN